MEVRIRLGPRSFLSQFSPHSVSSNYIVILSVGTLKGYEAPVTASVPGKLWFYVLCISNFWGSSLPWDLNPLMDLSRVVVFQFVYKHFSCYNDRSDVFQALYVGLETRVKNVYFWKLRQAKRRTKSPIISSPWDKKLEYCYISFQLFFYLYNCFMHYFKHSEKT